jgi:NAD+ synthase (glutamine-hydrolysing)
VKIALAQINPTVGDFSGNLEKIVAASHRAAEQGARLTVFSELASAAILRPTSLRSQAFWRAAAGRG